MSKEHYTKNTVEASAWCLKCGKTTMHRVDQDKMQGRLGPCLICANRKQVEEPISEPESTQLEIFK